jgi:hypothetical protein
VGRRGTLVGVDYDEVAEELYGLSPGQFTPVRTAREKAAKAAGDRDLAARIRQLRKPSTSAWLANQLIRSRRDQLEPLLALGEQLRELQASVGADQLRQLTQQRHRLVYALAQEARGLGHDRGVAISDDVARELEQTLHSALGDPDAAAALRGGRLTTGLQYAGFGPVEGLPSNADAAPVARRPAERPLGRTKTSAKAEDDLAARRERAEQLRQARQEAQEVLDRARAELTDAQARREEAEQETEDAAHRAEAAREHLDQVRLDLDDAEEAMTTADHQLKSSRRDADSARRAAQLAAQRVTGAERRLAALSGDN